MSRIALINPLGDPGIGTYTHELAEAIVATGVEADVFTSSSPWTQSLTRHHRLFPVTGSALVRQRHAIRLASSASTPPRPGKRGNGASPETSPAGPSRIPKFIKAGLRETYLSVEFALWLRARGYDVLWTQWPSVPHRAISLWSAAQTAGLRVIHTAHNVFPHELSAGDRERCEHVYQRADRIVVHSRMAREALAVAFPGTAEKLVVAPHGLYTAYPSSVDGRARVREQLGVSSETTLILFFGGIRPYKNVDVAISALSEETSGQFHMLVAGRESGYPDLDDSDPLGRTRRLVERAGVQDRVHFMTGPFSYQATSDLFDAADVVLLPYTESWGSGLLLLAMSFRKSVIVTRTGGMDEYVQNYPASVILEHANAGSVLAALHTSRALSGSEPSRPPELEWPHIVRALLPRVLL